MLLCVCLCVLIFGARVNNRDSNLELGPLSFSLTLFYLLLLIVATGRMDVDRRIIHHQALKTFGVYMLWTEINNICLIRRLENM